MRRTLLCGLVAAIFAIVTSWSDMARRAAAKQSGANVGGTHQGVAVASVPMPPVRGYETH